jgi:hypothetical protein
VFEQLSEVMSKVQNLGTTDLALLALVLALLAPLTVLWRKEK